MDIIRSTTDGTFKVVGKRCDRCLAEVRAHRSLAEELQIYEFVRLEVFAGYAADHFQDGDEWAADLCERCVFQLHAQHLRLIRSFEESDLESAKRAGLQEWLLVDYRAAARQRRDRYRLDITK